MNIPPYTQLRDLSCNIATRFVPHTEKNVVNLEMVQRSSTSIVRRTDKHDYRESLEQMG